MRNKEALKAYEKNKVEISGNKATLRKEVAFYTIYSTSNVDYELSIGEDFLKEINYQTRDGYLIKKGKPRLYSLVKNSKDRNALSKERRWRKIEPEHDIYQENKYSLYFLKDDRGENVGVYKIVKLSRRIYGKVEPQVVNYYKRKE